MARPEFFPIDVSHDPTPINEEGVPADVRIYEDNTVQVIGAFTGSLRLEGSPDGSLWIEISAFTAPGILKIDGAYQYLRFRTAALSSGTPSAYHGGFNSRAT